MGTVVRATNVRSMWQSSVEIEGYSMLHHFETELSLRVHDGWYVPAKHTWARPKQEFTHSTLDVVIQSLIDLAATQYHHYCSLILASQARCPGFDSQWLQAVLLFSTNFSSYSNFKISILIISTCIFIMSPLHRYLYIILSHYGSCDSTDEDPRIEMFGPCTWSIVFVLRKSSTIPDSHINLSLTLLAWSKMIQALLDIYTLVLITLSSVVCIP